MATRYDLNVRALDVVGVAGVVTVTCQLCDSDHDPVVGYTDDGEIVDRFSGYTDSDGELTLSLVANSAITPANTYYSLRVGSRRFLIEKGTSTQTVQQALAGSPAALASALALDQLSDVYAPSPSNGQALIYDSGDSRWEAADVATQAELDVVSTGLANHLADTSDAHDASAISFAATGSIAATDVQAAVAEVDSEKLAKASNLSDVANAATAFGNIKQAATTDATGVVELATTAEVQTGTDTSRAVTAAGHAGYHDTVWIPSTAMASLANSPSLTAYQRTALTDRIPMWSLDASAIETIGFPGVLVPRGWATLDIEVWTLAPEGSAGNVVMNVIYQDFGTVGGSTASVVVGSNLTFDRGVQGTATPRVFESGVACTGGGVFRVSVRRNGSDAADTFAADIGVIGVMLRRAS